MYSLYDVYGLTMYELHQPSPCTTYYISLTLQLNVSCITHVVATHVCDGKTVSGLTQTNSMTKYNMATNRAHGMMSYMLLIIVHYTTPLTKKKKCIAVQVILMSHKFSLSGLRRLRRGYLGEAS